jgi:Partial alpha/beta-hydrolase lipase region
LVEKRAGYVMEKHKVVTVDGYVLTMYRIPHGKYRNTAPGPRPVVMLQHGVTLSSNSFVVLNANESMAFILADAGVCRMSFGNRLAMRSAVRFTNPNASNRENREM